MSTEGITYYKGIKRNTDEYCVFKVFDEPHQRITGLMCGNIEYTVEAETIGNGRVYKFVNLKECEKYYCIENQIDETEYFIYMHIKTILNEIYKSPNNGYPRQDNVRNSVLGLVKDVPEFLEKLYGKKEN